MDGLEVMIVNMGFAVAVAAFLLKWMVDTLNKKLDKIIETQEMIANTLSEVAATQKLLVQLVGREVAEIKD